jgi:hypothetical protein
MLFRIVVDRGWTAVVGVGNMFWKGVGGTVDDEEVEKDAEVVLSNTCGGAVLGIRLTLALMGLFVISMGLVGGRCVGGAGR